MSYFHQLPNVYVGEGIKDDEGFKYRLVKNLMRRVQLRESIEKFVTQFENVSIGTGQRPSDVAMGAFGDPHLDWVILLVNNITDVYTEWPKDDRSLYDYCVDKYNLENVDGNHHYETNEVKYNGDIFIKRGIQVNKSFRAILPDGTTKTESESLTPISNFEHETFVNEKKRLIKIPTTFLVDKIVSEFEDLVAYLPNAELDDFNNKKTPLSVAQRFLDTRGYISASVSRSVDVGNVTSYDNGPSSLSVNLQTAAGVATSTSTTSTSTTSTSTTSTTTTTTSSSTSSSSSSSGSSSSSSGGY